MVKMVEGRVRPLTLSVAMLRKLLVRPPASVLPCARNLVSLHLDLNQS